MSEIKSKLQANLKDAMKSRNQDVLTTLRGLMAAIKQFEVDTRTDASDEKITSIIQKEIKMRRDALEFAESQKRADLIDKNKNEISLLQGYLAEQMSEEDLKNEISKHISSGMNTIGQIMGTLNKEHKGKFEGKLASKLISDLLK